MPAKQPWMKFYPSDWRADQALRVCSLAARGLWIECMCIMHEAEPYGHLVINGRPVTDTQLASLTGVAVDQLAALLSELEDAGVFSRNGRGVIYSRRMTRDEKKSRTARKNGKNGGNPTLSKQKKNTSSDNPRDKPQDKGRLKTQIPDTRVQIDSESDRDSESRSPPSEQDSDSAKTEAAASAPGYAFSGKVIKLKQRDFEQWRQSFSAIPDLRAELTALDVFYADLPAKERRNWFIRCSKALGNSHQRFLREAMDQAHDPPKRKRLELF